jgi:hypothetical protein
MVSTGALSRSLDLLLSETNNYRASIWDCVGVLEPTISSSLTLTLPKETTLSNDIITANKTFETPLMEANPIPAIKFDFKTATACGMTESASACGTTESACGMTESASACGTTESACGMTESACGMTESACGKSDFTFSTDIKENAKNDGCDEMGDGLVGEMYAMCVRDRLFFVNYVLRILDYVSNPLLDLPPTRSKENDMAEDAKYASSIDDENSPWIAQLHAIALMTHRERISHAILRAKKLYCDDQCPMMDCTNHFWSQHPTQKPAWRLRSRSLDRVDPDHCANPNHHEQKNKDISTLKKDPKGTCGVFVCARCESLSFCSLSCSAYEHNCSKETQNMEMVAASCQMEALRVLKNANSDLIGNLFDHFHPNKSWYFNAIRRNFTFSHIYSPLFISEFIQNRFNHLHPSLVGQNSNDDDDDDDDDGLRSLCENDQDLPLLFHLLEAIIVDRFLESQFGNTFSLSYESRTKNTTTQKNTTPQKIWSESTLRLFSDTVCTACVVCARPFETREKMAKCVTCGIASTCRKCKPSVHSPKYCTFIAQILYHALSHNLSFNN